MECIEGRFGCVVRKRVPQPNQARRSQRASTCASGTLLEIHQGHSEKFKGSRSTQLHHKLMKCLASACRFSSGSTQDSCDLPAVCQTAWDLHLGDWCDLLLKKIAWGRKQNTPAGPRVVPVRPHLPKAGQVQLLLSHASVIRCPSLSLNIQAVETSECLPLTSFHQNLTLITSVNSDSFVYFCRFRSPFVDLPRPCLAKR